MNLAGKITLLLSSLLLSVSASAAWRLNIGTSQLYYVTNKAAVISEINSFGGLEGEITDDGYAVVEIILSSVDTQVDIRDQRMRDIVFEAARFPLATVDLVVNSDELTAMNPGDYVQRAYSANVSIKGSSMSITMDLSVTKLADGGLLVQNVTPIMLNTQIIGLSAEVEQMRELAALPSINPNIMVNVKLEFEPVM